MGNYLVVLAWLLFLPSTCNTHILDIKDFLSSLIEYFSIHHVIFLKPVKGADVIISTQKSFSEDVLYTSVLSYADVAELANRGDVDYVNSLVIIYSDDFGFQKSDLIEISNEVDISLFKWVLITKKYHPKDYERLKIPFNCLFVIAEGSESDEYVLTEIYDTLTVSKLSNYLGKWTTENGLEATSLGLFTRRGNLSNVTFSIASNHRDPCSTHSFEREPGSVMRCIHYRTFPILAQLHNFSINWVVRNYTEEPGLEVLSSEIHFTLFDVASVKHENLTLLWPTIRTPLEIYTSYAGQGFGWTTFVHPFSKEMWIALLMWFSASAAVLSATEFIILNLDKISPRQKCSVLWLKYIFLCFSAFCGQSEGRYPERISLRILVYLTFLIPTALVPGYSAALTSFLAVKIGKMPFTNIEGLAKAKDYKLGFHSSFNFSQLKDEDARAEAVRAMVRNIVGPERELPNAGVVTQESAGIRKICEEKYSFLTSQYSLMAIPPECPYFKLDRPIALAFTFLPVRLNLPYKSLINFSFRKLLFSRIVAKEATRILPLSMNLDYVIENKKSDTLSPISFHNVVSVYVCLGFGTFVSVLIFFAEVLHFKGTKSKLNGLTLNTNFACYK